MSYQTGIGQRTVVVTGAASPRGIGRAAALRFAEEGWAVAILDLDGPGALQAASEIAEATGQPTIGVACNVAVQQSVSEAAQTINADSNLPPVGALAAIAGIASPVSFMDVDLELWHRVIDVNLTGTFLTCQAFLPAMLENGYGRIVTMSSVSAQKANYFQNSLFSSKGWHSRTHSLIGSGSGRSWNYCELYCTRSRRNRHSRRLHR